MKKISIFVILILGILFVGSFSMAFGEMMSTVGVNNGDVFRYGYASYFSSNDPNAVPPSSFASINQTDYFMINVTGVSGSSVDFSTMLRGLNGSNSYGICSMNVGTGMASISGYGGPTEANSFYFMARNVGMMGRMFPSSNGSPTINDTLMMNYNSGQRLTNHFITSTTQNGMMIQSDFYFDQATGMIVEWRQQNILTSGNLQTNSTQMMKITSSSVWTIPEFPITFAISAFAASTIAIVSASMIIIRKRKNRSSQ